MSGVRFDLEIEDTLLPWNNRTFTSAFPMDTAKYREPAEYKLKMGIGTLTTLLLGYRRPSVCMSWSASRAGKRQRNGWMTCTVP